MLTIITLQSHHLHYPYFTDEETDTNGRVQIICKHWSKNLNLDILTPECIPKSLLVNFKKQICYTTDRKRGVDN